MKSDSDEKPYKNFQSYAKLYMVNCYDGVFENPRHERMTGYFFCHGW